MTRKTLLSWGVVGCALLTAGSHAAYAADIVKTVPTTSGINIRLGSSEKNGCAWGDLDIIDFELAASKSKGLLVSLEAVDGSGAAQTKSILGVDLTKGFVASFAKPSTPGLYGIYVCKDSDKKGRCVGKPAAQPHTLLNQYLHTGPAVPKPKVGPDGKELPNATEPTLAGEPGDKIYYFAPISVEKSAVTVVATSVADAEYTALESKLKAAGAKDVSTSLSQAKSISKTLHSVQPEFDGTRLVANLPRLNKSECSMNRSLSKVKK